MKKTNTILSVLFVILALSCNKSTDFYEELGKGAYLTLVKLDNNILKPTQPTSTVSMKVNAYGEPVESVNLYVATSATLDKTKWKLIKNIPFTTETLISATVQEIATVVGLTPATLPAGAVYTLYNEVVLKDGRKFGAYNTSGPDLESQPAFNLAHTWQGVVVCPPFELADHYDNVIYEVVRDDWEDVFPGDEVVIKLGPGADEITLVDIYPTGFDHKDMVLKIDKTTGVVKVPRYTYGGYSAAGSRYTAATTGGFNFVFPCKTTPLLDITLNHVTTSGGVLGNFRLILEKK